MRGVKMEMEIEMAISESVVAAPATEEILVSL